MLAFKVISEALRYLFGDRGAIVFVLLVLATLCYLIYRSIKKRNKKRLAGIEAWYTATHVFGLPRSEGCKVLVDLFVDNIVFSVGSGKNPLNIGIPKEQITAIASKTESEIIGSIEQGYTTGGLGLAMIGGLVLGPVGMLTGAIVGRKRSHSKTKNVTKQSFYFVFNSNSNLPYILLKTKNRNKLNRFVDKCNMLYIDERFKQFNKNY